MNCRDALATVLDQVDYTTGNCRPNEMVGAVLPKEIITLARASIAEFDHFFKLGMEAANRVFEEQAGNLTKREPDDGDAPTETELSNDELDSDYQLWSNM